MIFFHALSTVEISEGLTERRSFKAGHTRDRPVLTHFENMGGRGREDSLSPVNTRIIFRIHPEHQTAHLPFGAAILKWRFQRHGISQIITDTPVDHESDSVQKQI